MSFIFFQIVKVSQYHTPKTNQNKQRFVLWNTYVCVLKMEKISLTHCHFVIYTTYTERILTYYHFKLDKDMFNSIVC